MSENLQNNKQNIVRHLFNLLLIAGILLMAGTVIRTSAYTVLVSDDFWHAQNTGVIKAGFLEQVKAAWDYNAFMFLNHQGAYSLFFLALFNPASFHDYDLLRVIMILNSVFFFYTVVILIRTLLGRILQEKNRTLFLLFTFIVIFVMTQYDAFAETFYWYTGATNYSFPVSFMNLVVVASLILTAGKTKKKLFLTIFASVMALLAAGGVLPIGGMMCYILLLVLLYQLLVHKKLSIPAVIIFISAFLGTLINVAAPGYRIREGVESAADRGLMTTIGYTFEVFKGNFEWLILSKNFALILLAFALCGALLAGKVSVNRAVYLGVSILALAIPFITIFPVVYGYNVAWIPNRCLFVTIFSIAVVYGNLAAVIGYAVWNALRETKGRVPTVIVFAIAFLILAVTTDYQPTEYTVAKINKQLFDRQYQEYHDKTIALYNDLENRKGEDVEVDVCLTPEDIRNFYAFFLSDNKDDRGNKAVSWAYGLNSIVNTRSE
ncbi:MAG: hypothetical protein E7305_11150 [Butyrivibrio sp.]|nr:hypothetical protein [Butyrivibrio sp.]